MPAAEPVLIVALSGRQLAASARRAGFASLVVDGFGDLDMMANAAGHALVSLDERLRFEAAPLRVAVDRLAPPPIPLVWGGGFDHAPELLGEIARGRELLGSDAAALRRVKDPASLAAILANVGVPHPELRLEPPLDLRGWVARTRGASGGTHIRPRSPKGDHWQQWTSGTAVSALVLGNGRSARTLCFSEQWADGTETAPFRYGGASAPATPALAAAMADAAARAVAACCLRGLVSVDMLADERGFVVLEVNPRPGAALEVYEAACGHSLFGMHVAACRGRLPDAPLRPRRHAAAALVWADRALRIPSSWQWPAWTADCGRPGTAIAKGAPVCTVRAVAQDAAGARRRCAWRVAILQERLATAP